MRIAVPSNLRTRTRKSLSPTILGRTLALALLALGIALATSLAALVVLGLAAGETLADTATGALVQSAGINAIVYGSALLAMLLGVLSISFLHAAAQRGERLLTGPALGLAVAALPRLLAALLLLGAAAVVAAAGWLPLSVLALVAAFALHLKHLRRMRHARQNTPVTTPATPAPPTAPTQPPTPAPAHAPIDARTRTSPATRRALLWAIPFLPLAATLGLLVAVVPATLSRPRSVRALLRLTTQSLRTRKQSLAVLALVVAPVTVGLSLAGASVATALQAGETDVLSPASLLSLLTLVVTLVLLMGFSGAAIAALSPADPADPAAPAPAPSATAPTADRTATPTFSPVGAGRILTSTRTRTAPTAHPAEPASARGGATGIFARALPALRGLAMVTVLAVFSTLLSVMPATAAPLDPATATATRTEITATLQGGPGSETRLGPAMIFNVAVTAPDDPAVTTITGDIEVYDGPTLVDTIGLASTTYGLYLPTGSLNAGPVQLRFVFVSDAGLLGSETTADVVMTPAMTSLFIQATPSFGGDIVWGESHTLMATVWSENDGPRTLVVRDGVYSDSPEVARVEFTVTDNAAEVPVDLTGALSPGFKKYRAEVLATANSYEAGTDEYSITVREAPTTVAVAVTGPGADPAEIFLGRPVTLTATVAPATGTATVPGTVTFTVPGYPLAPVAVDASGVATTTFTPAWNGPISVTAVYDHTSSPRTYAASTSSTVTVTPVRSAAWTTIRWLGDLTLTDTQLEIIYGSEPGSGLPTPTGSVVILDYYGGVAGAGVLVDGVLTTSVRPVPGLGNYTAQYSGDTWFAPQDLTLYQLAQAYRPKVALTAPVSDPIAGNTFSVDVTVTDVPLDKIASVTVYDGAAFGRGALGTVRLDSAGAGSLQVTLDEPGVHDLTARVEYTTGTALPATDSAPLPIDVQPALVPDLRVTTTTPADRLLPGQPIDLVVTAHTLPGGTTTGLRSGATVTVGDQSVVLVTSPEGLSGTVQVRAPQRGGVLALQARGEYGPWSQIVLSPMLELTILPPATVLWVGQNGATIVGDYLTADVQAYPPIGYTGDARSLTVEVGIAGSNMFGDVIPAETRTVVLFRVGDSGPFSGSTRFLMRHAGSFTLTATTAGDGIDTGAATARNGASVDRQQTTVTVATTGIRAAGEPLEVRAYVSQARPSSAVAAPTGALVISTSGGSCAADQSGACTLPGGAIRAGTNRLSVTYAGDADNSPAQGSLDFQASARASWLDLTFSPTPDQWVDGGQVTASWATTTSGRPAVGTVTARIGAATCTGPAAAGSCVVSIPTRVYGESSAQVTYSADFNSADDAPSITRYLGYTVPQGCFYPRVLNGTIDLTDAVACQRGDRTGVLAGSVITVRPLTLPARYVLDRWSLDGYITSGAVDPVDGSRILTLTVSNDHRIDYFTRYEPKCFTLTLSPAQTEWFQAGRLQALTAPNCDDPKGPTPAELQQKAAGTPRYAEGTEVDLFASYPIDNPAAAPTGRPTLDLVSLDGAEQLSPYFGRVLMDRDRTVSATFKVHECLAVSTEVNEGGTLAIESAYRPASSQFYEPSSGACTDRSGRPGFVPGTTLNLRATPNAGAHLESIGESTERCTAEFNGACMRSVTGFPLHVVGSEKLKTTTLTKRVLLDRPIRFAAQFGAVRCVQVTSITSSQPGTGTVPWTREAGYGPSTPVNGVSLTLLRDDGSTEVGCGGNKSESSEQVVGINVERTESVWLVQSGSIDVSTKSPQISYGKNGGSRVSWSTSRGEPVTKRGVNASVAGPRIDLTAVDQGITINAIWYATDCRVPVQNPQNGPIAVVNAYPTDLCGEGEVSASQTAWVDALPMPGAPGLTTFFSIAPPPFPDLYPELVKQFTPASDGRWYSKSGWITYSPSFQYFEARLEYCAPLNLTVYQIDDQGVNTPGWGLVTENVGDNGGCPPGWAQPGRQVGIGLSSAGNYSYTLVKNADGASAKVVLDAQGNRTSEAGLPLRLKVRCQTVNLGDDVWFGTPGNCPGGGENRFLRGTVVQVETEVDDLETFYGWRGVAESQDMTAWVIASEDRTVTANIDKPSDTVKVINTATNVVQRLASYAVTYLTGVLLAKLAIVKGISLALKGVTTLLHSVGVEGKVLDALDRGSEIIDKQFEMIKLMSTCMQQWSSGSSKKPVKVLPPPPKFTGSDITGQVSDYLQSSLDQGAETGINTLAKRNKVAEAFATNIGNYTSNSIQNYSDLPDVVGSCLSEGAKKYTSGY